MRILLFVVTIISYFNSVGVFSAENHLNSKNLKFIFHNSYDYPLMKLDSNGNIESGILKDIAVEISHQLGSSQKIIFTSRGRIDQMLIDGIADLSCYARKEWTKNPDLYEWSEPLFNIEELVIYKSTTPAISKIEDLKNKRIGTLINYKYPEVEEKLGAHSFIADNAINMSASFEKLLKDRVQYIFTDSMYYYNLKTDIFLQQKIILEKFVLSKTPILCRLSRKSKINISDLNSVIKKLKREHFFENVIKKYSPTYQSLEQKIESRFYKIAIN